MPSDFLTADQCERFLGYQTILDDESCWLWHGPLSEKGYGRFRVGPSKVRAHRLAWRWEFGAIPDGQYVLHHCDTPACCNPHHLFLGTQQDNMDDCGQKGRRAVGDRSAAVKLTAQSVREIRDLNRRGARMADIARQYGVRPQTIDAILAGTTWRWLPDDAEAGTTPLPPVYKIPRRKGEENSQAKLTAAAVQEIRRLSRQGWIGKAIAAKMGVSRAVISSVLRGRTWAWLPDEEGEDG